jgi:hypothetical protein
MAMDRLRRHPFVWDDRRGDFELVVTAISSNFRERREEITGRRRLENQRAPPWGFKRSYLWKSGGVRLTVATRAVLVCGRAVRRARVPEKGVRPELTRRETGRQTALAGELVKSDDGWGVGEFILRMAGRRRGVGEVRSS